MSNGWQIAPAIENTPENDARSALLRLVDQKPRPYGKRSRRAIKVFANPADPRPCSKACYRCLDPAKHQFCTVQPVFVINTVEKLDQVFLGLK